MLTLKKESCSGECSLTLASRQPLFSREFCVALSWAIGLHALGLLLFTIQMITYTGSTALLEPITVLTEPLELANSSAIISDAASSSQEKNRLPEPPSMGLEPPSFIHDAFATSSIHRSRTLTLPQWTQPQPIPPPIRISATGHLAGQAFEAPSSLPPLRLQGDYQTAYQVRVDGETGNILWYKLQRSSQVPAVDRAAEEIVRHIHFKSSPLFIQSGEVEIAFHLDQPYD